jgi:hypothetical protein
MALPTTQPHTCRLLLPAADAPPRLLCRPPEELSQPFDTQVVLAHSYLGGEEPAPGGVQGRGMEGKTAWEAQREGRQVCQGQEAHSTQHPQHELRVGLPGGCLES